ncbi:SPOR domain-containing protein [Phaeovulum sp. NW3]|uniref:SPOR domain-containing protein n=1 Tax=Phaeovulum sp. NW3 TaxID=2934933 RepID=UPI00201FBB71|nr:SPOR domain-containing protein [Phaeovulum sp. NW3]MCL7464438.1 SPOR domain-containing protein [Phaeovulum sp. NW3]
MSRQEIRRFALVLAAGAVLAGCEAGTLPFAGLGGDAVAPEGAGASAPAGIERDVEAPKVFAAEGDGLWDGRPSLGGVWVAHPDVKDPERVLIRNTTNGKSVVGALFRREREQPGPRLQVSSDAAAELGMLAGAPTKLSVVALRREVVAAPEPLVEGPVIAEGSAISGEVIEARPIAEIANSASQAIAKAEAAPATPTPAPAPEAGFKAYAQIGIFSVEANAKRAATQMTDAGLTAAIRKEESQGKTFWRVVAGPAATVAERNAMLTKIKGLGYADAYAISN